MLIKALVSKEGIKRGKCYDTIYSPDPDAVRVVDGSGVKVWLQKGEYKKMRERKMHYRSYEDYYRGICGAWSKVTNEHEEVTCKSCLRIMKARGIIKDEPVLNDNGVVYDDPRIAALIGNQPVTVKDVYVGAKVMSMAFGMIEILEIDGSKVRHHDIFGKDYRWLDLDDKSHLEILYWPNGIIQPKPRKTKTIKETIVPIKGGNCFWVINNDDINNYNAKFINGPEQEIELIVWDNSNE